MTDSILAEFAIAGVVAVLWPAAAIVAAVRAFGRTRALAALAVDARLACERTLWAGVVAVGAMFFGLVLLMNSAMRKSSHPVELFVIMFLVFNAVGLALTALPLAVTAARGHALDVRAWIGLTLACGVFAFVWGPLYTVLYGSFYLTLAPSPGWFAAVWPIAAVVAHAALPRHEAAAQRAGVRLAWSSLALASAAVVSGAAIFLGGADRALGHWLFPHHIAWLVAASIAGIGALARGERPALAGSAIAIVAAMLLAQAISVGAGLAL